MATDKVTFVGHSTLLIEAAGKKILTDPWYNEPVYGGIHHRRPPGIPLEQLKDIDVILLSHNHKDHFDEKALEQLDKNALVILPGDKLAQKVRSMGYSRVEVLEPWQEINEGGLTINAVPAKHPVYEVGYMIGGGDTTFYFAGDAQSIPNLSSVAERFKVDVALLPIAGLKMLFFMRAVMGPEEAAKTAKTLGAKVLIPIHYDLGIRSMAKLMVTQVPDSVDKLKEAMEEEGCASELVILEEGGSYP